MNDEAKKNLQKALKIRKEAIGTNSLPVAAVHEELGKLYLEEENFQDSYNELNQCYTNRKQAY